MQNNVQDILSAFQQRYASPEAEIMHAMLMEHLTTSGKINDTDWLALKSEILTGRPVQYIIGKTYFSDFEVQVSEGVLIPRPETDELAYWINQELEQGHGTKYIWDIGTGSGCIALAIKKKNPTAEVFASDLSDAALAIARQNADRLLLNIHFLKDDILLERRSAVLPEMNIMVSNPPYIMPEEYHHMDPHVKYFEPNNALFVTDNDPLQFYKAIERAAATQLAYNGILFLELHSLFARETKDFFENMGWDTLLRKDMQGRTEC